MTPADPYPSRVGGEAQVRTRKDPVVHAPRERGRRKGVLSPKQLAAYESRGFVTLESLFEPKETKHLQSEVRRIFEKRHDDSSPKVVREPARDELRSIFAIHEDEEVVHDLLQHPRLISLVDQILGGPAYVHQSRVNHKPAFRGQPVHWHSDFETWHVEDGMPRMSAFSLSLNLAPTRHENGPMLVMPESHHYFIACPARRSQARRERASRGEGQEVGVPPDEVVQKMAEDHGLESTVGPEGSATIFDCNLMHASNGNVTPFPRTNLFLVFNRVDNALAPPYSGGPARPQHLANRNPKPLS